MVKVFTGGFSGTSQKTAHHDCRGTESQCLDNVTDVTDTAIGNGRNAKLARKFGNLVDSSSLTATTGHDFLSDTDGAGAHTDTETVSASSDQVGSLLAGNDVSGNDIKLGEILLDPADHLQLIDGVALRRVQDNNVEASLNEQSQTILVIGAGANGSADQELLAVSRLGSQGVILVLEQVRAGQKRDEAAFLIDDGKLALLGGLEDFVGFSESDTLLGNDQIGGHDVLQLGGRVIVELNVTGSNNANKLAMQLAGICETHKVSFSWLHNDKNNRDG